MNFNLNVLQHIHSDITDTDKSLFCICKMPYDDNRLVIKTIIEPILFICLQELWVKKANSRKSSSVSFRCSGSCTFTGCPLEFKVEIMYFDINNPPETLQMTVSFTSSFERRSRHLCGLKRRQIAE